MSERFKGAESPRSVRPKLVYWTVSMSQHIFKKFARSETLPGRLRIQPRDVALLQNLASFRFLNTEQIVALHPGGMRNLRRRLNWLYHSGYVDRPPQQTLSSFSSTHIIYGLGEKGAELLFEDLKERAEKIKLVQMDQKTAFPSFAHALMISQFHAVLTLALKDTGGKIIRWSQGYDLRDMLRVRGQTPELVPDAFFTIEQDDGLWNFFLEADRSTEAHHIFLSKMKTYWEWSRNKTYNDHLNITRFRVLTITPSEERKENLRITAKNADTRREGSNMYLFACEKDYSLKTPEAVLAPIWLSPKDDMEHKILE